MNLGEITFLGFQFRFFSNLFEVFASIHRLFMLTSLRWWFDMKNEKVLRFYLEIRMRRRRKSSWIFFEFLVGDLLLRTEKCTGKFPLLLLWFESFFNSSSSPLWSYKFFELVLELQWFEFSDDDSASNLWELSPIHWNCVEFLVLRT